MSERDELSTADLARPRGDGPGPAPVPPSESDRVGYSQPIAGDSDYRTADGTGARVVAPDGSTVDSGQTTLPPPATGGDPDGVRTDAARTDAAGTDGDLGGARTDAARTTDGDLGGGRTDAVRTTGGDTGAAGPTGTRPDGTTVDRDGDGDPDGGGRPDAVGAPGAPGTAPTAAPAPASDSGSGPLLAGDHSEGFRARWTDVQTGFVDSPREAVQKADALVAELMQHLASTFADERSRLESQWDRDGDVPTDDLRTAFQRYRSFFERLLST